MAHGLYAGALPIVGGTSLQQASFTIAPESSNKTADYYTDGVDDHVQIQAAIDSLGTDGGLIHLAKGNYVLGATVVLNHKITLEGEGRDVTEVYLAGSVNDDILRTTDVATAADRWLNICIRDITFDGNKTYNTAGDGFDIQGCWKLNITRVIIRQVAKVGLRIGGTTTSTLETHLEDLFITDTGEQAIYHSAFDTHGYNVYVDTTDSQSGVTLASDNNVFFHLHVFNAAESGIRLITGTKNNTLIQCVGDTNTHGGIRVDGNWNQLIGCEAFNNSSGLANDHSGIEITGQYNIVTGGHFWDTRSSSGSRMQKYGIEERTTGNNNYFAFNNVIQNKTGQILVLGSGTRVFSNPDYVTENSGTGTINSGSTSATITHGLSVTPSAEDIIITLKELSTSDPGQIYVDNIGATTFQVNCRNNPGASNLDFGWRVITL